MTRKNVMAKFAAIVALIAIVSSVIWTGILVIYETLNSSPNSENSLTQEQLQELLNAYSWSLSNSWTEISTWIMLDTQNTDTLTWINN
jgi:predicted PurR-regulated permease PerM